MVKRVGVLMVAAALGTGAAAGVAACGEDREGEVQFETNGTGTEGGTGTETAAGTETEAETETETERGETETEGGETETEGEETAP
jgi:hypothetical protein